MCACLEHHCPACDWIAIDNKIGPKICPKCGGKVYHLCDETPEPPIRDGDYYCDEEEENE